MNLEEMLETLNDCDATAEMAELYDAEMAELYDAEMAERYAEMAERYAEMAERYAAACWQRRA